MPRQLPSVPAAERSPKTRRGVEKGWPHASAHAFPGGIKEVLICQRISWLFMQKYAKGNWSTHSWFKLLIIEVGAHFLIFHVQSGVQSISGFSSQCWGEIKSNEIELAEFFRKVSARLLSRTSAGRSMLWWARLTWGSSLARATT